MAISSKVNIIVLLVFELASYDIAVQYISHDVMGVSREKKKVSDQQVKQPLLTLRT